MYQVKHRLVDLIKGSLMWKKKTPCKTGDPNGMPVHLSKCLLTVRGLSGPATYMPSCSMMWSGTSPAFLSFHSFKTCRSDSLDVIPDVG